MKKGNFRTKRIYPKKGEIKFVIEARINGRWKIMSSAENSLIFENQKDADDSLMAIFGFCNLYKLKSELNKPNENTKRNL